jgi:RNA-directed DNA polymerase
MARWPSARATAAAKQRIRELTDRRLLLLPPEDVITNLNRFLTGWGGYFRFGNSTRQFDKIDRYALDRVARFLGARHQKRRTLAHGRGLLFGRRPDLMPRRLSGTVRYYRSAHATR